MFEKVLSNKGEAKSRNFIEELTMSQNTQKSSVVESSAACAPEYMIISHPVHGRIFMREGKANVMRP